MLPIETKLNFEAISEIKDQGYSRIPVFQDERTNIIHILFAKDLLFIDPDDEKPIEEVCKFYKNEVNFVYGDTSLTEMLDEFKSGEKGHMAVVQETLLKVGCHIHYIKHHLHSFQGRFTSKKYLQSISPSVKLLRKSIKGVNVTLIMTLLVWLL